MARSAIVNVMLKAARKASRSLIRDFGEVENLQVSLKGPGDFVSTADRRAEKIIYDILSSARPGYGFLMEESGAIAGSDKTHRWIVDPLDGTTNFLHGIPLFAVSIALEREGRLQSGLVLDPIADDLFIAERGQGAFLNDRRIRIAARRKPETSVISTGIPHIARGDHELHLRELAPIMQRFAGIRRTGSAALDLSWTAAGRFDVYWERNISAWDMAAGVLIAREAGAIVTDADGHDNMLESGSVLCANEFLHPLVLDIIRSR